MLEKVLAFLSAYTEEFGALAALLTIGGLIFGIVKAQFAKTKSVNLSSETIEQLKPKAAADGPSLSVTDFIRLRRELKADLETELADAGAAKKDQLLARIAELESQIANPEQSLVEAKSRIRDLEANLERAGNDIGGDRIAEARVALEKGDYSIADDLFAEIEARAEIEIQNAARAAFGRGEVAEAEVRWADAALHYARSANLDPTVENLIRAAEFAKLSGDFFAALRFAEHSVAMARAAHDDVNLSRALDRQATALQELGQHSAAEPLFQEALRIVGNTDGKRSSIYATRLNNLAVVVLKQGRYAEAEAIYKQVLEIDLATIGHAHPEYAKHLANLASVITALGRHAEAEALFRQALKIARKTIGDTHPNYAIRLGNLGKLLGATGASEDARKTLEQALTIFRNTLPQDHPYISDTVALLADLSPPNGTVAPKK